MIKIINKISFCLLLCIAATAFPISNAHAAKVLPPEALIKALQGGGYIIYMRHEKTLRKSASRDGLEIDFTQCNTQRNLSQEGIESARHTGHIIKSLAIPIGEVRSSPYCRTVDTAQLVYGKYEIDNKLAFSLAKKKAESDLLGKYLLDSMLATHDIDKNTVFVGHTANLKDGLGVWPKPEGVAVIFQKINHEIVYKGMIKPTDWINGSR